MSRHSMVSGGRSRPSRSPRRARAAAGPGPSWRGWAALSWAMSISLRFSPRWGRRSSTLRPAFSPSTSATSEGSAGIWETSTNGGGTATSYRASKAWDMVSPGSWAARLRSCTRLPTTCPRAPAPGPGARLPRCGAGPPRRGPPPGGPTPAGAPGCGSGPANGRATGPPPRSVRPGPPGPSPRAAAWPAPRPGPRKTPASV